METLLALGIRKGGKKRGHSEFPGALRVKRGKRKGDRLLF
jgi:hypothetical protein